MKKNNKNISVVIPNYNGSQLLKQYLPSVLKELESGDELIIVDDASTDKSVSYLKKKHELKKSKASFSTQVTSNYYPNKDELLYDYYSGIISINNKKISVKLLALQKNMRFAAAVNAGVLLVSNNHFLLLNTDVKLTDGCRASLLSAMSENTFGVGCLEYEDDLNGEKSGKNKLWFSKGMFIHSKATDMTSGLTAWVSGGSGLFDTEKWKELDGFDQLFYPAYWEDIDISFRARKKGWGVLFEENAVVLHKHESTNTDVYGSQKMLKMSWRNADAFTLKNGTWWQVLLHLIWKPYWKHKRAQFLQDKVEL